MGDDKKAVVWHGVLKAEEMRKVYSRNEELYNGERLDSFLIALKCIGISVGLAAVLFGLCLIIIHINTSI